VYIVTIREIRPVVAAPAFLSPKRRAGDEAAHRQNTCRPPVARIERLILLQSCIEIVPRRIKDGQRPHQPFAIPEESDVPPHDARQLNRVGLQSRRKPARRSLRRLRGRGRSRGLVRSHRTSRPRAEDEALEQRIAGEAVGAMHARAGNLACGKQAGDGRSPIEIRPDAAHDVVGRWPDRNAIAREIQPSSSARL